MTDMPVSRLPNAPNSYTNGCILYTMWGRSCSSALQDVAGGQHEKRRFISLHGHSVPCHLHLHHIPICFIHSFCCAKHLHNPWDEFSAHHRSKYWNWYHPPFFPGSWKEILAAIDAKLKRIHMLEMIINISYILTFSCNSETTAQTQVTWEDLLMNPWQSLGGFEPFNCMGLERNGPVSGWEAGNTDLPAQGLQSSPAMKCVSCWWE